MWLEAFGMSGLLGDAVLKITCAGSQALSGLEPLSAYSSGSQALSGFEPLSANRIDFFNCKNVAENFWNVGFTGAVVLKITCAGS